MTHSAESCYLFNDKRREELKELSSKREEIAKKHKIKVIAGVYPLLEHEIFYIK